MTVALAAYQQALRAQHPDAHAPDECPCKDGCDYQPVAWSRYPYCTRPHAIHMHASDARPGTTCADCDPRLAPGATLPPEVVAACAAAAFVGASAIHANLCPEIEKNADEMADALERQEAALAAERARADRYATALRRIVERGHHAATCIEPGYSAKPTSEWRCAPECPTATAKRALEGK